MKNEEILKLPLLEYTERIKFNSSNNGIKLTVVEVQAIVVMCTSYDSLDHSKYINNMKYLLTLSDTGELAKI